jgi:FAD:protein FMN transferase
MRSDWLSGVSCRRAHLPAAAGLLTCLIAGGPGGATAQEDAVTAPGGVARARFLMGTSLSIETDAPAPAGALDAAFDEVARLEGILSNWRRTSELSRLNDLGASVRVRCSAELFGAVRVALRWAEATDGAFDPTVEPLVRALGLRGDEGRLPGAEEVPKPGPRGTEPSAPLPIGWRHVHLHRPARSIRFDVVGMGLDLGGIGKGMALDAAAGVLRHHGVRRALLDFGGQVLAIRDRRDSPAWTIGIADPEDRDRVIAVIGIDALSVATSSNSERFVETPHGRIGHLLDPATAGPARFRGSVTVAARDATSADALSTALFVMGPDTGTSWADARGVPALYLWRDDSGALRYRRSRAFVERFGAAIPGPDGRVGSEPSAQASADVREAG